LETEVRVKDTEIKRIKNNIGEVKGLKNNDRLSAKRSIDQA